MREIPLTRGAYDAAALQHFGPFAQPNLAAERTA